MALTTLNSVYQVSLPEGTARSFLLDKLHSPKMFNSRIWMSPDTRKKNISRGRARVEGAEYLHRCLRL